MIISILFILFLGLAWGFAVGAGFVAFLAVLGIIPRLSQLTKTMAYIQGYEWSVVAGAAAGGWMSLRNTVLHLPKIAAVPIGLMDGMFIGLLAAALTEVLNVLPILAKRIGIAEQIIIMLMAIVLGKVCGSLYHWLVFVHL
ncbi:stage V sporulation protein AB [Bacillus mangrovi]|uniref:Stage V sporulation protein AB n=1 Tax=Metabacillus mangrovi TaxID=1491830 RepID=A0A7X2S1Z8_9BACI|nr:stage V sporulation protein AB [Metabacillus mangrovi]MTH52248.1 stage V sporulation protein AB [Metabacillus mangrovi]